MLPSMTETFPFLVKDVDIMIAAILVSIIKPHIVESGTFLSFFLVRHVFCYRYHSFYNFFTFFFFFHFSKFSFIWFLMVTGNHYAQIFIRVH